MTGSKFDADQLGIFPSSKYTIYIQVHGVLTSIGSLYNIDKLSPTTPLLLHLPPSPTIDDTRVPLPSFIQRFPVATINYRWDMFQDRIPGSSVYNAGKAQSWPTPVHDVGFSFAWLSENLRPLGTGRQFVYAYGSYLGASLATSLALTECHPHSPFAVRGLVAYNGIYNWTMFLPDHKVNRPAKKGSVTSKPMTFGSEHMKSLWEQLPALFGEPTNLFDCFGSPSLFFHNPGLIEPASFYQSSEEAAAIKAIADGELPISNIQQARKSHLIFPPRTSTLKIPETLLLHDSVPPSIRSKAARSKTIKKTASNTFGSQAMELAELMWRSIDVVELKERAKWDEDIAVWADEAKRRVQLTDVGNEHPDLTLNTAGAKLIEDWLAARFPLA